MIVYIEQSQRHIFKGEKSKVKVSICRMHLYTCMYACVYIFIYLCVYVYTDTHRISLERHIRNW